MEIMHIIIIILLIGNILIGAINPNRVGHCVGWILALIYYLHIIKIL